MKKLLFLFLAVTLLTACDEKATDDSLSVSKDLLEFDTEGGTQEFQILTNHNWEIIIASGKTDVALSAKNGTGNANISVTLPFTHSISDVETRLIVRTDDGSSIRNIVLLQHGYLLNGTTLYVANVSNMLHFNGKANSVDSLSIVSNVAWQLKGPEWIEAFNGTTWVKLSPERAMVSGPATMKDNANESYSLKLRTVSENTDDMWRQGLLILQSTYEGAEDYQIEVEQMGKYQVVADKVINLSHALGWSWKYGAGVERILCYVGEFQSLDTREWMEVNPEDPCGVDGLKANTPYHIFAGGFDINWQPSYFEPVDVGIMTEPGTNQPRAIISNVKTDGNLFTWDVIQNQYSYMYNTMIIDASSIWADLNDGYLAWLFRYAMSQDKEIASGYTHRQKSFSFSAAHDILISTWGVAKGNNNKKMSGIITRYNTKSMKKAPTRSTESELRFDSCPFDKDEFKKSVILIK